MIIVNARFLTQKITGVQRFALEMSKQLQKLDKDIEFVTHPGIIHHELANQLSAKTIGLNKSHLWEQVDLFLYLKLKQNPLLVSFGYTGPLIYSKQIVTIHDMAFKYYRETFSKSFGFAYNFLVPRLAKRCLHIFTVSNSAKKELVRELEINEEKITVVYNGVSDVFMMKNAKESSIKTTDKYILTVSSHHPRKNYKRLIRAFSKIKDHNIKLYIIGNKVSNFSNELLEEDFQLNKRVVFLKNVSDVDLAWYYENAKLFIFPSLYEGFGIPAIEAMLKGRKLVLSDIPVFREIGNEDIVYVDPFDIESISAGIEKGLKDCSNIKEYPKLENFSWERSARKASIVISRFKE